jgi:hypothetical protein
MKALTYEIKGLFILSLSFPNYPFLSRFRLLSLSFVIYSKTKAKSPK